ncbi:hypothetical protein ABM130_03380 [Enterococcus cecorum]
MMKVEQKELYKNAVEKRKFSDLEKEDYLVPIVKIVEDDIEWMDNDSVIYLWALFGESDSEGEFECVQVGASIDGRDEIEKDICKMNDSNCTGLDSGRKVNTQFYTNVYFVPDEDGVDKSKYQYRKIREDYKTLIFCKIDINKYLNVDDTQIDNQHLRDIFNLSKAYYAETKFAFDTQSIYWNAYRSGVGMETLKQLIPKS